MLKTLILLFFLLLLNYFYWHNLWWGGTSHLEASVRKSMQIYKLYFNHLAMLGSLSYLLLCFGSNYWHFKPENYHRLSVIYNATLSIFVTKWKMLTKPKILFWWDTTHWDCLPTGVWNLSENEISLLFSFLFVVHYLCLLILRVNRWRCKILLRFKKQLPVQAKYLEYQGLCKSLVALFDIKRLLKWILI